MAATTQTVTSHAEKFAHIISADHQYVRSVRRTPTKHAIGIGTSIGWMGCRKMRIEERGFATDNVFLTGALDTRALERFADTNGSQTSWPTLLRKPGSGLDP